MHNFWLVMGGKPDGFHGYTDSDWASQVHHHLISAYVFRIGTGAITWSSKKQSLVALSCMKVEYIAQTHAAKEAIWFHMYWCAITTDRLDLPTKLNSDNQGAIALAKSTSYHAWTKHINIQYHFIWDTVEQQEISLTYCPTEDMVANILTKPLPCQQFKKLYGFLGLRAA
jgi:hypothetical protein